MRMPPGGTDVQSEGERGGCSFSHYFQLIVLVATGYLPVAVVVAVEVLNTDKVAELTSGEVARLNTDNVVNAYPGISTRSSSSKTYL